MVSDISLPDWFFRNQTQDIKVVTEEQSFDQEKKEQSEIMDDHLPL